MKYIIYNTHGQFRIWAEDNGHSIRDFRIIQHEAQLMGLRNVTIFVLPLPADATPEKCRIMQRLQIQADVLGITVIRPGRPKKSDLAIELHEIWWDEQAANGDPMNIPNPTRKAFLAGFAAALGRCWNDTNGDGDCGRPTCPRCPSKKEGGPRNRGEDDERAKPRDFFGPLRGRPASLAKADEPTEETADPYAVAKFRIAAEFRDAIRKAKAGCPTGCIGDTHVLTCPNSPHPSPFQEETAEDVDRREYEESHEFRSSDDDEVPM